MKHFGLFLKASAFLCACLIGGAGCFQKKTTIIESPTSTESEIRVSPNLEGAKASTGGIQATITPVLNSVSLASALPEDDALKGFTASAVQETKDPVPMQDGTRSEFATVTKTFTKQDKVQTLAIKASITDTRSIPVLTAFIESYSEYTNDVSMRKKIRIQDTDAWLTYQRQDGGGYGSVTMIYRGRFLIRIDGNLGISQDQLLQTLNAYQFENLK